jgi:hypothetical protein
MLFETRVASLLVALSSARFMYCAESDLQDAVAELLARNGIAYEREVRLSKRDRVDFMVDGDIALELKVKTSGTALTSQVLRYAEHWRVKAIVVAGTTHHVRNVVVSANGKPVFPVQLRAW